MHLLSLRALITQDRQGVGRDQWQLDQHRLALARGQSLLPRSHVNVVEIWRPCFIPRVWLHLFPVIRTLNITRSWKHLAFVQRGILDEPRQQLGIRAVERLPFCTLGWVPEHEPTLLVLNLSSKDYY